MERRAILLAGAEGRFLEKITAFEEYLLEIGCLVETIRVTEDPLYAMRRLLHACIDTPSASPLLVTYEGHGDRRGWDSGSVILPIPYWGITTVLKRRSGPLLLINDTCYGACYLRRLQKFRSDGDTCFISTWDSYEQTSGGVIRDALEYWPHGRKVEDVIVKHFVERDGIEREEPVQIRWGAELERMFFPSSA